MFQLYFDHIQALMYINQGEYALKIYFVIYEISQILKTWIWDRPSRCALSNLYNILCTVNT